ncbi:MAG: hypothetical protein AB7O62_18905 [Pirellulales bacterium]
MTDARGISPQVLVTCRQCGLLFRTHSHYVGGQAPCPSCGQLLPITATTRILAPTPAAIVPPVADPPGEAPVAPLPTEDAAAVSVPAAEPPPISATEADSEEPRAAPNPPPVLRASGPPPVIARPKYQVTDDRATWGCLLKGALAFSLFAGGIMILVAAIVAVVPARGENWAQQKWSGVVCSLLAATVFMLPGWWLWRKIRQQIPHG